MTCQRCNGTHRVPWPEAGMMQDCDCTRTARACEAELRAAGHYAADQPFGPDVVAFANPWVLPDGWMWWSDADGWGAVREGTSRIVYTRFHGDITSSFPSDATPALVDLIRRRNIEDPAPRARRTPTNPPADPWALPDGWTRDDVAGRRTARSPDRHTGVHVFAGLAVQTIGPDHPDIERVISILLREARVAR